MIEETTKEIGDDLEMLSAELQMERKSVVLAGERMPHVAEVREMRDMQDSDGMSDWLAVQWSILRDAGLIHESN